MSTYTPPENPFWNIGDMVVLNEEGQNYFKSCKVAAITTEEFMKPHTVRSGYTKAEVVIHDGVWTQARKQYFDLYIDFEVEWI